MSGMGRGGQLGMRGGAMLRGGQRLGRDKLPPRAREGLDRAAAMVRDGQHAEAADQFSKMAVMAHERSLPAMAARLAARAAQCAIAAGDAGSASQRARQAIDYGVGLGEKRRAARKLVKLLADMRAANMGPSADEIEAYAKVTLGLKELPTTTATGAVNRSQRRLLPKGCPTCGGPVAADDVEWNDDGSADCQFCGSNLF